MDETQAEVPQMQGEAGENALLGMATLLEM